MSNYRTETNRGLTLLGVVVATTVLAISIVAITRLMAQTEHNVGSSRERFVAVNLAREGIELMRAKRDTNWLSGTDWTADICNDSFAADRQLTIEADPILGVFINDGAQLDDQQLNLDADGRYTHQSGAPTPYRRVLTVDCSQHEVDNEAEEPAVIDLISAVAWSSRDQDRTASIRTRLYNWHREP